MNANINEMNEVIARFDGWTKRPERIINPEKHPFYYLKQGFTFRYIEDFNYHSSWDALMPVVEKLKESLYEIWNTSKIHEQPQIEISLNTNTVKLVDVETGWYLIDPVSKDTLKETVYHACYEIIKWLNQQKQNDDN